MLNATETEFQIKRETPVCVIAEAGVNHDGSIEVAKELIDVAAEAGADYVKFQTFRTESLVTKNAPMANYQVRNTGVKESQFEMLKRLELDLDAHFTLMARCKSKGIRFLSTPFDLPSARILIDKVKLPILKVPSGELTNGPLLLELSRAGLPLVVSTGMATMADIEAALGALAFGYLKLENPSTAAFTQAYISQNGRDVLRRKVLLLHCTSQYPAPYEDINLRAMRTMKRAFQLPVGYSDHSKGISVPVAAVALGAKLIEKHFTLDKKRPGPDHKASLEPQELKLMVQHIRETEQALGSSVKQPTRSDLENLGVARKSIVASRLIQAGEKLSVENIDVMRPGSGMSPMAYWDKIGKIASKRYETGELILE